MSPMGFRLKGAADEKKSKRELKTVADVQQVLKSEIITCEEFKGAIAKEIREIEDLEHNLKIIEEQMETIRKLAEEREKIMESLLIERNKIETQIDTKLCRKLIQMTQYIDAEIRPMINEVGTELGRLTKTETHDLYNKSEGIRSAMGTIDKRARLISVEMRLISKRITDFDAELGEINQKINGIEAERAQRVPPKGRMGFR